MKVVIDIPQKLCVEIKQSYSIRLDDKSTNKIIKAIRNGTVLPQNPTNGDMIKVMFPNQDSDNGDSVALLDIDGYVITTIHKKWWNAPYERSTDADSD